MSEPEKPGAGGRKTLSEPGVKGNRAGHGGGRRDSAQAPSTFEDAFNKITPRRLEKAERLHKSQGRYSLNELGQNEGGRRGSEAKVTGDPSSSQVLSSEATLRSERVPSETKRRIAESETESSGTDLSGTSSHVARAKVRQKSLNRQTFCTTRGYVKFLIVLALLQGLTAVAWLAVLFLAILYWPVRIVGTRLDPDVAFIQTTMGKVIVSLVGLEPVYTLILFLVCLKLSFKKPSWIRIYYTVAPWLLCCLVFLGFYVLFYFDHINERSVEAEIRREIIMFDDPSTEPDLLQGSSAPVDYDSANSLNRIQTFYECCGLRNYSDWIRLSRNFYDDEDRLKDPKYWLVPLSCCKTPLAAKDKDRCTKDVDPKLIWKTGCLSSVVGVLVVIGASIAVLLLLSTLLTAITIMAATFYYARLRRHDGTYYHHGFCNFVFELFCLYCCRKPRDKVGRRTSVIIPINVDPEDMDEPEEPPPVDQDKKRSSMPGDGKKHSILNEAEAKKNSIVPGGKQLKKNSVPVPTSTGPKQPSVVFPPQQKKFSLPPRSVVFPPQQKKFSLPPRKS